ncbi:MAG: mevalonate kinase [Chloroflexi bacterium]|nr:mevalonate kinase [Chloroflexota bacterium]
MPAIYAKAPGKIILFGEHAVVYGQPAIAIPVNKVSATARVLPKISGGKNQVRIKASDVQLDTALSDLDKNHPIAVAIQQVLNAIELDQLPSLTLMISSTIPIAAGMGSSAAITIAIIRALTDFLGKPLTTEAISALAFEVEKIHHGTPSGIDNQVIAHQKPMLYSPGKPIEQLIIREPTHWVIADSGEESPTKSTVADVRKLHAQDPESYDQVFEKIGQITLKARPALIAGDTGTLGQLMLENQYFLEQLAVSSPKLEKLISAAVSAGAIGAKLSGGGRGGNMIALAPSEKTQPIEAALLAAGATRVITTTLIKKGRD